MKEKVLLWCWVANALNVLIPKKRGAGFLRVPYGHHHIRELSAIADSVGSDVCGLEGALEFECSGSVYHGGTEVRKTYTSKVIPQLEQYYGLRAKEVTEPEFWINHPILKSKNNKEVL